MSCSSQIFLWEINKIASAGIDHIAQIVGKSGQKVCDVFWSTNNYTISLVTLVV